MACDVAQTRLSALWAIEAAWVIALAGCGGGGSPAFVSNIASPPTISIPVVPTPVVTVSTDIGSSSGSASVHEVVPDNDGNLLLGAAKSQQLSIHSGDTLQFKNLSPADSVVEVANANLTSAQLCAEPTLPTGSAHAVIAQSPLPAGHYDTNEISGPYRTYPAGIFAMAVGSGECGYIEKTSTCQAPNEELTGVVIRPQGGSDYLCKVTRYLMNVSDPAQPSSNPPQVNPACSLGRTMDSTWSDPAVQGVFVRLSWKDINTGYNKYDWSILDRAFISALRYGKSVTVGIEVGGNSIPEWVFTSGIPGGGAARKVQLRDWGTSADSKPNANCGFDWAVASPSDLAFKVLFKKVLSDLGAHVRTDQRFFNVLSGVKVTGMGMATLENRLPARCNIAVRNSALGDSGTQGHIVSLASANLGNPVFDTKYSNNADPTESRIKDVSQCICNPQVLSAAGYRPSTLRQFYSEVEATLLENFGYKQQIFMNISDGFPQIGEGGRFVGDHLVPPILSKGTSSAGLPEYTYGQVAQKPAVVPADIPGANDTTTGLLEDGRNGVFAGNDKSRARVFGVENAALAPIGFSRYPNQGAKCTQQVGIDTGVFVGSAAFPVPGDARIDATGVGCPNVLATSEGVAYNKVTGFQVENSVGSASDLDAALWNMTLNTNGVYFEPYEQGAWRARKESASNPNGALNASPDILRELATPNYAAATPKSGSAWNTLLLARAKALSADPANQNLFQANPFPGEYSVKLVAKAGTTRYFFNGRACAAYASKGTPVRIHAVTVTN